MSSKTVGRKLWKHLNWNQLNLWKQVHSNNTNKRDHNKPINHPDDMNLPFEANKKVSFRRHISMGEQ